MSRETNKMTMSQNRNSMWRAGICAVLILLAWPTSSGGQAGMAGPIKHQFLNNSGAICSGCKLYSWAAGTSTPLSTYTTSALSTPNDNPTILDSAGRVSGSSGIYLTAASYKFELTTAADVSLWVQDNVADVKYLAGLAVAAVIQTATDTGTQNNYVLTDNVTLLRMNNASLTTFTGFVAGDTGQIVEIVSVGAGQVDLVNESGSSTAANRILTGGVSLSAGTGTVRLVYDSTTARWRVTGSSASASQGVCQGRLTLTSQLAVTTADVTAATTIRFTPYLGNLISIYDGAAWANYTFTELSLALGTLIAALPYDVFIYNNAGTLTLEFSAWTNGTTRATALVLQDGIKVKSGATTRRYLGTFYTTSTTTTEDSFTKRFLWNNYHRVPRGLRVVDTTDSWSYTTAAYRQARAAATNQVEYVIGDAESLVALFLAAYVANDTGTKVHRAAISLDSATVPATNGQPAFTYTPGAGLISQVNASLIVHPVVGYHYSAWLEFGPGTNTSTWYGDNTDAAQALAGLAGWIL